MPRRRPPSPDEVSAVLVAGSAALPEGRRPQSLSWSRPRPSLSITSRQDGDSSSSSSDDDEPDRSTGRIHPFPARPARPDKNSARPKKKRLGVLQQPGISLGDGPVTALPCPPVTPLPAAQFRFGANPHQSNLPLSSPSPITHHPFPYDHLPCASPPATPSPLGTRPGLASSAAPSPLSKRLLKRAPPRVGRNSNQPSSFASPSPAPSNETAAPSPLLPLFPVRPPCWGYGRQEMCETLPWWRAFQSGVRCLQSSPFPPPLSADPAGNSSST